LAHERNAATSEFVESVQEVARFELGLLVGILPAKTFDALKALFLTLGFAGDLLEDSALSKDVTEYTNNSRNTTNSFEFNK
jgi:hypothetical protein